MKLLLVNSQINQLDTALDYTSGGKNVEKAFGWEDFLLISLLLL